MPYSLIDSLLHQILIELLLFVWHLRGYNKQVDPQVNILNFNEQEGSSSLQGGKGQETGRNTSWGEVDVIRLGSEVRLLCIIDV